MPRTEARREARRRHHKKLRRDVLTAYGDICVCCGEMTRAFLAVDHVHNNGNAWRRENGSGSYKFYAMLRAQGYPKGEYQILCHNCKFGKAKYGKCPHRMRLLSRALCAMRRQLGNVRRVLTRQISQAGSSVREFCRHQISEHRRSS